MISMHVLYFQVDIIFKKYLVAVDTTQSWKQRISEQPEWYSGKLA